MKNRTIEGVAMRFLLDRVYPEAALTGSSTDSFRWQETTFVLLNLGVYFVLLGAAVVFPEHFENPTTKFVVVVATVILVLLAELAWLHSNAFRLGEHGASYLTYATVGLNLLAGFAISIVLDQHDNPYPAVLYIPVLIAALRLPFAQMIGAAVMASAIDFFGCWLLAYRHPPGEAGEIFEAGEQTFIMFFVGIVVWISIDFLRRKERLVLSNAAKLAETQARLATEERLAAVGRLSAAIAHEIRNPVAMIASSLAMSKRASDPKAREEMFEIAEKESRRLEHLTNDFLAYARPRPCERRAAAIEDSIRYIGDVCQARAAETGVEIRVECEPELWVNVDADQIRQALLNLAMNAVEASERGQTVTLRSRLDAANEIVLVEVENGNGPIPDDVVGRVFEPFFTSKPTGTGLGLAIAHKAAVSNGGSITLSRNTARSVTFSLKLPLATRPVAAEVSSGPNSTGR